MAGKVVSKNKLASVIKTGESRSEDLAEKDVSTQAVASFGNLVTPEILRPEVEDVVLADAEAASKDYVEELKFNEELVTLTIAEDTSEFPIDPVPLSVNGKQIFVKRNEPTKVPRKYIECLCNPILRVRTKQTKNNLGEDATLLDRTRSLQFPFSITDDPNPRGRQWLRALLSRE